LRTTKLCGVGAYTSFATDRDHLKKLFRKHRPTVVVIEACLLAGWGHDLCLVRDVANTASEACVPPAFLLFGG
jgi:hypothetical protein